MRNIKNTVLGLGLAIALTFGFNTSVNAAGFGVEQVEQGNTIIEDMVMRGSTLTMSIECLSNSTLTVYSTTGVVLYSVQVNTGIVTIPVQGWEPGSYYIALVEGKTSTFASISIN